MFYAFFILLSKPYSTAGSFLARRSKKQNHAIAATSRTPYLILNTDLHLCYVPPKLNEIHHTLLLLQYPNKQT